MVSKNNKKVIRIILIVAFGIYVLSYFGVFEDESSLAVVPVPIDSGTNPFSPYQCPPEAGYCQVRGTMFCDTETTGSPIVIARTDDSDFSSGWISYDNGAGGLNGYAYSSKVGLRNINRGPKENRMSDGWVKDIYKSSGKIHVYVGKENRYTAYSRCSTHPDHPVCQSGEVKVGEEKVSCNPGAKYRSICQDDYYHEYSLGSGADVSTTPKNNCQGVEICEGEVSSYSCSADVMINNDVKQTLVYSSQTQGNRQSSQYTIQPGDNFYVIGGDSVEIEYTAYVEEQICFSDFCDEQGTGYYECVNERPGTFHACPYGCEGGECLDAFEITGIELKNPQGVEKTTFKKDEPITLYLTIVSPSGVEVTSRIREGNPVDGEIIQPLQPTNHPSGRKPYQFAGIQSQGTYYITFDIKIPTGEVISYGAGAGETIPFTVSTEFNATFRLPYQTISGKTNREKLYINYPINIELVTQSGNDNIFLDEDPTINRASIGTINIINNLGSPEVVEGLYTYTYTPLVTGKLDIQATTTYGGLPKQVSIEAQIIPENVQVTWKKIASQDYDIARVYSMEVGKPYDFEFETRNLGGNLIETGNELIVYEVTKDVSKTNLVDGKGGKYSFTYTPMDVGGYEFKITSSGANIESSTLTSGQIQASDEPPPPGCVQDSECGFLKKCMDGKCGLKLELIVLIIGSVFIVLILIVITMKLVKGRKPSFEL